MGPGILDVLFEYWPVFLKGTHLNLASNQISTEGLKIIQHEVIASKALKYLNLGISEGSFRVNNFSGDGGIIIARILLNNESIEAIFFQENLLGKYAGDKIGELWFKIKH